MPNDLKRFQRAEALPFIPFSCFHRLAFLEAPGPRETIEDLLEETLGTSSSQGLRFRGVVEIESEWTARVRGPLIAIKPR